MPTTDIVTVNTGGGADYTDLVTAIATEARDLTASDEIVIFRCSGSAADTASVTAASWAGFVCDATRYIQIEPASGQEHGGAWNTGVYRLEVSNLTPIVLPTTASTVYHIRVRGLQIRMIASTGSTGRQCVNGGVGISSNSIFDIQNCILRTSKTGGTGTHKSITIGDSNWTPVYIGNCLVIGDGTPGSSAIHRNSTGNWYSHNNGVVGGFNIAYDDAQNSSTGTLQVKNCWAKDCTTFSAGAGIENSDYNSTDLGTATGGANDRVSQTFTFVDEGGGDYRPDGTDAAIRLRGVDLSGDANLPITLDMNGDPVNAPPDIGPLVAESSEAEPAETRWRIYRAAA